MTCIINLIQGETMHFSKVRIHYICGIGSDFGIVDLSTLASVVFWIEPLEQMQLTIELADHNTLA